MLNRKSLAVVLSPVFLLVACATAPMGPTVQVMPSANKPFPIFQQDQEQCKAYAQSQIAGQVDSANNASVGQAAIGVLLGTALGAAVGDHQGAGVGAAAGAIAGTSVGAGTAQNAQFSIQQQYNTAYTQCMYSRGNQVPGALVGRPMAPPPVVSVAPQQRGMSIEQAQIRLNALGYTKGRPDGAMGPKTHSALALFQKDRGLPETGELDAGTAAELNK
jgi:hypothetical protein